MTAGLPVATRAILTAFSIASAPEVDEDRLLLGAPAGRQLGQAPADVDVRLVEADHDALVEIAVDLLVHRRDRRRQAVAGVLTADPAREVDVLLAVDVLDPDALGPRDHDRRSRHATGDVALLLLDQALGLSVLSKRHASESIPFRSSRPWTTWRQRLTRLGHLDHAEVR